MTRKVARLAFKAVPRRVSIASFVSGPGVAASPPYFSSTTCPRFSALPAASSACAWMRSGVRAPSSVIDHSAKFDRVAFAWTPLTTTFLTSPLSAQTPNQKLVSGCRQMSDHRDRRQIVHRVERLAFAEWRPAFGLEGVLQLIGHRREYGYFFQAAKAKDFDPSLNIMKPDGTKACVDIRTLSFVRLEDNVTHCQRRHGFNLGGGVSFGEPNVGGVGPDEKHPLHQELQSVVLATRLTISGAGRSPGRSGHPSAS